ncbi:MAG: ATP-binding protein [Caldilineaceae bacterium]
MELTTVATWIHAEQCRAIGIFGMSGIGKTMLATKLALELRTDFAAICWRSLHNAPPLGEFIGDCLTGLTVIDANALPATAEKRQALLLQILREQRCLLVIDNFETVMEEGSSVGGYRLGYEPYAEFLRRLAESAHGSCVILTSQEKPVEFAVMEGDGLPIRALTLQGFHPADVQQLLRSKHLHGAQEAWEQFCSRYSGNPLALKLAADAIREIFAGDIKAFLTTDATLFHDVRELLDQQFSRLTLLEREILYWLGIEREMVTLQTLQVNLAHAMPQFQLLEALRSLRRRSLIEQQQTGFGLSNVVLQYVTERLVTLCTAEIEAEMPLMLSSFALLKTQTKAYLRDTQIRLLILPVLERLHHALQTDEIAAKLWRMLDKVRGKQESSQLRHSPHGANRIRASGPH